MNAPIVITTHPKCQDKYFTGGVPVALVGNLQAVLFSGFSTLFLPFSGKVPLKLRIAALAHAARAISPQTTCYRPVA